MIRLRLAVLLALLTGCSNEAGDSPEETQTAVDVDSPADCEPCHSVLVQEYADSMHARSHYERDPIFAGVRSLRMKKEGPQIAEACDRCHTPRQKTAAPEQMAGVTCAACHTTHAGADPDTLLGPNDVAPNVTPAHGTGPAAPVFADGMSLCLICHAALSSPKGVVMCTTGPEHAASPNQKSCVECHMPTTDGAGTEDVARTSHASHAFVGPHRAWYQDDPGLLASAVTLEGELTATSLTVSVTNQTDHSLPTGFPGRMAIITCTGQDATGQDIWSCDKKVLGKVYVNAEGEKTLAPFATELKSDTRLEAKGHRTFTFTPPEGVRTVDVQVIMRLLPPPLAKKIGLEGQIESEPRLIAEAQLNRKQTD
jgi:hypothetical protein